MTWGCLIAGSALVVGACGQPDAGEIDAAGNGSPRIDAATGSGSGSGSGGATDAGIGPDSGGHVIQILNDGIVLDTGHNGPVPLTVRIVDSVGHPQAGLPISWTMISGTAAYPNQFYCPPSAMTDAMGLSTCEMVGEQITTGAVSETVIMRVSIASGSTVDLRTVVVQEYLPGSSGYLLMFLTPESQIMPAMHVGDTLTASVRLQMYSNINGHAIPDVGIHFTESSNTTPAPPSTIARCNDGFAYTDSTGIATCNVHALAASTTIFDATVGDARGFHVSLDVM